MLKDMVEAASALSLLLLCGCGSGERAPAPENGVKAAAGGTDNAGLSDPIEPGISANAVADPAPPPDAVSHPGGYLPLGPPEGNAAAANATSPDPSPPSTEDEYLRNRAGRP